MTRSLCLILVLLTTGCDRAAQPDAATEFHGLAERGQTAPLLAGLERRGNVDVRDYCQRTPLMFAAQFGRVDTVQALVAAGARVDLHEKGYYTALMLAAGNGHTEVVRLLADAGARVDEVELTHGWTALIWAAKRGHAQTVSLLLTLDANTGVRDDRGWTALDWATAQGHAPVIELLTSAGHDA